jgi:hypothetical protein
MGLTRAALIFAAGYVLGRPEGRAKVAELAKRPEVTQLREQAASTVSSGLKSGKEQLTKATGRADKVSDQVSSTGNGSGPGYSDRRRRRLPSFPRRGARPARSGAITTTAPVGTTPATATSGSTSKSSVAVDRDSTDTAPTVTASTSGIPAGPSDSGSTPPATGSGEPEVRPAPSARPITPGSADEVR